MFSIIIPLYNKAPYIEKALRSIQAQTFREFEVIVIDDGSTDNSWILTRNLFQEFENDHVLSPPLGGFRGASQKNAGVSTARNNGIKLAKYPYICFLDADDWWAPTFLAEMKQLIEGFPEAGIYGTSYYKVKDGVIKSANIGVEKDFERGLINYYQVYAKTLWMPLWTGAVCVPKVVFDNIAGFKSNLRLGEDFDLWVRIASNHPVAFLNKPLAYYNQDVDLHNRAVGVRYYKPDEHMLFTNYGDMMNNDEFRFLFERLALYSLLPYYLNDKNPSYVKSILSGVKDWKMHEQKYSLYYRYLPKYIVKRFFQVRNYLYNIKMTLRKKQAVELS